MCEVDLNITRKFFCASNCIFAYSSNLPEIYCSYIYNDLFVCQSCSMLMGR